MKNITKLIIILIILIIPSSIIADVETVDVDLMLDQASALIEQEKYAEAIKSCNEIIKIDKKNSPAYALRGRANFELKNYDLALKDYTTAITLDPTNMSAYFNRGRLYVELKDNDNAIFDFKKAIEINPEFLDAYIKRGDAYCNIKDFDAAFKDYTFVITTAPTAYAYGARSVLYACKLEFDLAINDVNTALELNPREPYCKLYKNIFYVGKYRYWIIFAPWLLIIIVLKILRAKRRKAKEKKL